MADEAGNLIIEETTIVGEQLIGQQIPGAAQYLGQAQLKTFEYSDIQRILRQVPGVSLQVEDGFGLRPNISIRGVSTERSGRITLLEDNVLISPAPYSAPSAYYFPTVGRMNAVEILKGPAAITQGPYTIGGAMNMISTPIPSSTSSGNILFEGGQDNTFRLHGTYGGQFENGFGFLVETHQWNSDGFQDIDRSNAHTGLAIEDFTAKLAYTSQDSRHSFELKLQYADQDSEQSYLGLTDADFRDDAFRRYGVSELDNISTLHEQQILRYSFAYSDNLSITATAYNNDHQRNWYKTEKFDLDGSTSAQDFSGTSWSNVVSAVNTSDSIGALTAADLQQILDGSSDTAVGSIQLRSNAREYVSRGVQLSVDWSTVAGNVSHEVRLGLRLHYDEEDRLQQNDTFQQLAGELVLNDLGLLGNAGNRLQQADALALHIYDKISFGNWVVSPGLRFEDISQQRTRWETRTGSTTDPASRADSNLRSERSNDIQVVLPGFGIQYAANDQLALIAGAHKGFTAPSNSPGAKEEQATNYELGARYSDDTTRAEVIYFLSDYTNLIGECTASSGTGCTIGDAFNGEAATVQGIELLYSTDLAAHLSSAGTTSFPVSFSYTYIDGQFDTDIADTDFFGDVSKGDPLPYIPEQQYSLTLGMENQGWAAYLSTSYVDEVCVRASCEVFERTDSTLSFDLSAHYYMNEQLRLFARLENMTAEEDILGRQPYGARPNKARTAALGFEYGF